MVPAGRRAIAGDARRLPEALRTAFEDGKGPAVGRKNRPRCVRACVPCVTVCCASCLRRVGGGAPRIGRDLLPAPVGPRGATPVHGIYPWTASERGEGRQSCAGTRRSRSMASAIGIPRARGRGPSPSDPKHGHRARWPPRMREARPLRASPPAWGRGKGRCPRPGMEDVGRTDRAVGDHGRPGRCWRADRLTFPRFREEHEKTPAGYGWGFGIGGGGGN